MIAEKEKLMLSAEFKPHKYLHEILKQNLPF